MIKFKWILWLLAAVLAVSGVTTAVILSQPGAGDTPADPSATTGTVGTQEICYSIVVTNQGGLPLGQVGIFIYADSSLKDLVWFDRTNDAGKMTFTQLQSDSYVAVLSEVPDGYEAEPYYLLSGEETTIVLNAGGTAEGPVTYDLGDPVMDFSVEDADGTVYTLSQLLAVKKVVVLNFWYIQCQPCKAEFPYLQAAYEKYSDEIALIGMNPINNDQAAVDAFAEELGLTFPMLSCDPQWEKTMGLAAYPTTVVIDRFGNICLIHTGTIDDAATFERIFHCFAADDYQQTLYSDIDQLPPLPEEGTAANPQQVVGKTTFELTIDPGKELFVEVARVTGMYMQVEGQTFYLLHDGNRHDSNNGTVGYVITTGDNYTPTVLGFGNPTDKPQTVRVNFSYLKGTYGNPYTLKLGDFTAKVEKGNEQGVYYLFTANADGALLLQHMGGTDGVKCGLTLYNLTTGAYRTLEEDGIEGAENPTVGVKISKGDKVQLIVAAMPDEDFNYPGGSFRLNARVGSEEELNENTVPKQEYTITVVDTENNKIPDVSFSILVDETPTVVKTDGKGVAVISLPIEDYVATLTVPAGYTCEITEYTLSKDAPACTVTLTPVVVVKHDYTVTVVDETEAPMKDVTVILGTAFATTDENGTAVFAQLEEASYKVEIMAPEGYIADAAGYAFPEGQWEMTVALEKEVVPGSPDSPIENSSYPMTTIRIEPQQQAHYKLSGAGGMVLTFLGEDGYVLYKNVKYTADAGGRISVLLDSGDDQLVIFGNEGATADNYYVTTEYPKGSAENPIVLTDISAFTVQLDAGDSDGKYHVWTASENREVTLRADSGNVCVSYGLKSISGKLSEGITFEVDVGDKITIQVAAQPVSGQYPQAQIDVTGTLKIPNSASNPQELTYISRVSLMLAEDKPQGHYYRWIAPYEGTVTFSFESVTAGVVGTIVLSSGGNEATMVGEQVQLKVMKNDPVLIRVATMSNGSATHPGGNLVFVGSFTPGNSADYPDVLTSIDSIAVDLEAGDDNGYYYQWTATDSGKVILTLADDADVDVTVSWGSKSSGFADGVVSGGKLAAVLEVEKDAVICIRVIANDSTYPAVRTTICGVLQLPNSETNPIDIHAYPFTTQAIANGSPVYYRLNGAAGMELIISDADAFVISGGSTYMPVAGKITVPVTSAAQVVAIGNNGSTEKTFTASVGYPLGSKENPQVLTSIDSIVTTLVQGDTDGYYYSWNVPGNGVATFRIDSISGSGITGDIILTVGETTRKLSMDGVYGVLTAELAGGDTVTLQILADPASATQITVAGALDQNPNGPENPALITDITEEMDVTLEAGDVDGYYYSWTADDDCTVELKLDDTEGKLFLSSNASSTESAMGKASLAVKKGQKLLIQVSFNGAAANMTMIAGVTYDQGTFRNPQVITDISSVAAELSAGDTDGYHYQWTNHIADGTVSFTATGGTVKVHVNGVAADSAANVAVKSGDKLVLQLLAQPQGEEYPAATVSVIGTFAHVAGSEQNPIDVTEYPYLTPSIPAGGICYFRLYNADGLTLGLSTGTDGCLIYGGNENYTGVVITGDAQIVAIRNEGTETCAYRMALSYPLGSEQNPEVLADISLIEKTLTDGQIYYYKWTVPGNGKLLMIRTSGYGAWMIIAGTSTTIKNNSGTTKTGLQAGTEILIKVQENSASATSANVYITGTYTYDTGTIQNPKSFTISQTTGKATLTGTLAAGNSSGYYHIWSGVKEGTLTVTRTSTAGELIVFVNGVEKARVTGSTPKSVYVEKDDEVLIQRIAAAPSYPQTSVSASVSFVEAVGSKDNPQVLTSLSGITAVLAEGNERGYYYSYHWEAQNDAVGTLFVNADVGAKAVVKLSVGETVATSSDGQAYIKIAGGDTVLIHVMAVAEADGYPALTTNLSGGIKVPVADPVEEGKLRYTVLVKEVNNFSISGLKVNFRIEGGSSVAIADVVNGEAVVDLVAGTYTVVPLDANGAYYFDSDVKATVTAENTQAELVVTKVVSVDESNTLKEEWYMSDDEAPWYAYGVGFGVTEVQLSTGAANYSADHGGNCFYVFKPSTAGTYRFATTNDDAVVSVWTASAAAFLKMESAYDGAANAVILQVLESQFTNGNQPIYLVGVKCAPSVTKTQLIVEDLKKIPQDISLMEADNSWYSGNEPEAFSFELQAGQSLVITPVDEKTAYTVVYSETDGYYHFDSVDGPVVYVNLNYSQLSFQQMINPGGSTGTGFRKFWMEDGVYTKKEDYTDVMTQYLLGACTVTQADTTYQLYPVTADMYHMLFVGGERWWNIDYNGGAEYIYRDAEGNKRTDVTLSPGWLFACCKVEVIG